MCSRPGADAVQNRSADPAVPADLSTDRPVGPRPRRADSDFARGLDDGPRTGRGHRTARRRSDRRPGPRRRRPRPKTPSTGDIRLGNDTHDDDGVWIVESARHRHAERRRRRRGPRPKPDGAVS